MLDDKESLAIVTYFLAEFIDMKKSPQDAAAKAAYKAKNVIDKLRKENKNLNNGFSFDPITQVNMNKMINELSISILEIEIDNLRQQLHDKTVACNSMVKNLGASLN